MQRRVNPAQRNSQAQLIQQALQMQQQQQQMMHRPMRGMITSAGFAPQRNQAMKRPMANSDNGANKHPKLMLRPGSGSGPRPSSGGAMCRICAQASGLTQLIKENDEIVEALKFVLNLDLDDDEDPAYPDVICKRCVSQLGSFSQFKKMYESGQLRLKEIAISKKRPSSPSNIAKTSTKIVSEAEASAMSILPDLDCEVDEGESVHPVHGSKPEDCESEPNKADVDDDRPDPLMCLQLGLSYDEDDEDANDEEVGNGHDEDEEDPDNGVEEIPDLGDDEDEVPDEENGEDGPEVEGEEAVDGVDLGHLDESLEIESEDGVENDMDESSTNRSEDDEEAGNGDEAGNDDEQDKDEDDDDDDDDDDEEA